MGVTIEGIGTKTLKVTGVSKLNPTRYRAIGDRIEAGTYVMAGLITGGDVKVRGFNPTHIANVTEKLREMGAVIDELEDGLHVRSDKPLKGADVSTEPFPGFPTDLQAQMLALMTLVNGTSVMTENIFENRFMHVPELVRLGADVKLKGNSAIVKGVSKLTAAPVMCTDLRASAALVLAALAANGKTNVLRVYHLDRGYERLDEKLRALGAVISREREEDMI
jgi:UDP-N-acetylglucosamine 1-carboxyvinyltransferase